MSPDAEQTAATAAARPDQPEVLAVGDAGAIRNTLVQLVSQVASLVFTVGLTLYLVRALGAAQYGVYALAGSASGLLLYPAILGLPLAVGRFLADHRSSAFQLREILKMGLRVQVVAVAVVGGGLMAASGAVADAYGNPHLGWPLRWAALSLIGQALFALLNSAAVSVRRASVGMWMTVAENVVETAAAIALVAGGAGAAGAMLGKVAGYSVAAAAGVVLMFRLLRRRSPGLLEPRRVTWRALMRFAGVMFTVEVTWSAITQLDVLMIGAILSTTAVGSFGAVLRLLGVLAYVGTAVSSGVAPRLSLSSGAADVRSFAIALRYMTIVQGLTIAPMIIWASPTADLLLGSGYRQAPEILRALAPYSFLGAAAPLVTLAVTYLGETRRRLPITVGTLAIGLALTYGLIRAIGVVGAAVADDVILLVYLLGHLWICAGLIALPLRRLALTVVRTLLAAAGMAALLGAVGTGHLSATQWVGGLIAGSLAYTVVLLGTREISLAEIRSLAGMVWRRGLRR